MARSSASSKEAARRLVQNIAKEHGYLGEEVYATMSPEIRRTVQEAFLNAYKLIGATVLTLAKNLYTKDVRWIFELLQNAEDNCFSRAETCGTLPYVSFAVHKDKVVVECNEDGFTKENLRAICKVGESSKTGAQGYIGEKGIGFKSVFKAAWKVHIQSGDYSFTFTHRKGDSGMGMISPEWCDSVEDLPTPLTRITLFLHPSDVSGTEDARRQNILNQLNQLQPTMLLFLKKLKQIKVRIYDDAENEVSSRVLSINHDDQPNVRILENVNTQGGDTRSRRQKYHIAETTARNLPHNENRTYSPEEEARKAYSTAPVVLAFPLSDKDEPIIEQQEVFAFLPVRREGFSFLIHSDFVTQANREDIVTTSSRNIRLLDAIADAFIVAVREMNLHPTLKYKWMRYLPKLTDDRWDTFWLRLVHKIKGLISDENIMILRDSMTPRKIYQTRRVSHMMSDQHGNPLFDDLQGDKACYISPYYKSNDLDLLNDYKLSFMYQNEWLERVARDLLSGSSRMRSADTDADWHTRAAKTLSSSFENKWVDQIAETKSLELIPLVNGRWVSPSKVDVHFATMENGVAIPTDIGFHLIDPAAEKIPNRKELFLHLGAKYASATDVRVKISKLYRGGGVTGVNYEASLSHLKFLYLTHDACPMPLSPVPYLWLWDNRGSWYPLAKNDSYSDTGFWELVPKTKEPLHWEGFHFINEKYFEDGPGHGTQCKLTWREWLQTCLGIRDRGRIVNQDGSNLSNECLFVSKSIPSKFLEFLKQGWAEEKDSLKPQLMEILRNQIVPCQNFPFKIELSKTYIPTQTLLKARGEFIQEGDVFPFLDLGENSGPMSQWEFLHDLGVISSLDIRFYFDILDYKLYQYHEKPGSSIDIPLIASLYKHIHMKCVEPTNIKEQEEKQSLMRDRTNSTVSKMFNQKNSIAIPARGNQNATFVTLSKSILSGPVDMETAYPVISLYKAKYQAAISRFPTLEEFFQDTLKIPKCTWEHIVKELKHLKESDRTGLLDRVGALYFELNTMKLSAASLEEMRKLFEEDALIFTDVGPQKWHKSLQCLWCAPSPIKGRVNLSNVYEKKLEEFFVKKLGVRVLDADIVYNELLQLDPVKTTVKHVKELLWTFNSQIELGHPKEAPEKFLKLRILPVSDVGGQVSLYSAETEFGIVDRKSLGDSFHGRVKLLDFSVNEIVQLKPLIKWAGLEKRYLSKLVQETSVLDSGFKVPISDPREDIRKKSYGLFRIAAHFNSPRVEGDGQDFYDLLRNSRTWKTQRISTTIIVHIDGQTVHLVADRGMVHIDDNDGLEIYVPHDEDLRDKTYVSDLPNRLTTWIMTNPSTKLKSEIDSSMALLIQSVLAAKPRQINYYLTQHGIVDVTLPEQEVQDHVVVRQPSPSLASSSTAIGPSTPSTPRIFGSPFVEPVTPLFDNDFVHELLETPATDYTQYSTHRGSSTRYRPSPAQSSPSPTPFTNSTVEQRRLATEEYRDLLSQVVRIARSSRILSEAMDLHELLDALIDDNTGNRVFSEYMLFNTLLGNGMHSIERDKKVGAAGELFVFELLSSMSPSLRGFNRANWKSTIRRYITVHPEYEDMPIWSGIETSDLEYEDVDSRLTSVLISKGHLNSGWRGSRPKYYIEVKTTPGDRDTPFFMSDAQYRKMKRLSTRESIYVIFRVSDLYTGGLTLDIYVDPVKLAEEGRLVFTADKWTVKPVLRL
ncbi:uncharacterized protein F4812DRAFT_471586 [Daldinia caldariorum]|uniref:uncharacterized protein n=1 Tax=Daldinia caldariorum TaxID=326644 RepID=UPI0020087BAD|nr:uncharacterized protein F4812DRAFT_471586 [Daldinia caldariorum]KAI1467613.1 hypothetical protein F4812DRAFT_471586 [Daldinia caldariorum]